MEGEPGVAEPSVPIGIHNDMAKGRLHGFHFRLSALIHPGVGFRRHIWIHSAVERSSDECCYYSEHKHAYIPNLVHIYLPLDVLWLQDI